MKPWSHLPKFGSHGRQAPRTSGALGVGPTLHGAKSLRNHRQNPAAIPTVVVLMCQEMTWADRRPMTGQVVKRCKTSNEFNVT